MKNRLLFSTIALISVVLFGGWHWWYKQHQQKIMSQGEQARYTDLVQANQAAANGREVIHLYTATWCGYCKLN